MTTIPPQGASPPTGSSSVQVRPSSPDRARRAGKSPDHRIRLEVPPSCEVMRSMTGTSFEVAKEAGSGSRSLQVRPPSSERFMQMPPLPWPLG